jgi:two-component system catabolic regulation response regulator CreB
MTVVVVEDDQSVGRLMHDALVAHGYDVKWCIDGVTATAAMENTTPDLVLLDAGLPDVDGFSLCRWLRERHRDLPSCW